MIGSMKPLAQGPCFGSRYSPPASYHRGNDPMRRCMHPTGNFFTGLDDNLLSRAEMLADMGKHAAVTACSQPSPNLPPQLRGDLIYGHAPPNIAASPHTSNPPRPHQMWDMMYNMGGGESPRTPSTKHHQMCAAGMESLEMMDHLNSSIANGMSSLCQMGDMSTPAAPVYSHPMNIMMPHHQHPSHPHHPHHQTAIVHDADTDPRELEAFSERFKQRRIKLGVTQADVGRALANLKLPGVGALSQSTICRFESLTLSHNNMIALKPVLQAWLEEAEAQMRNKRRDPEAPSVLPNAEKKRKRTSIAAPEKRSLEAYFSVQPRPSSEKIAAIAEKLDLKKNVVRVWFCNQRQKQKRMKFAAQHL